MNNLNVIDTFMQTFIRYIDSGFGLLQGDVAALTSVLIGIDITLAGLFWAMDGEANVLARLIKKVLYVGSFAFIINNFSTLSMLIFNSFSTLGLDATGSGLTAADLLRPGKLAGTGFQAAWPMLQQAGSLMGFTTVFTHLVTILVLVGAWFIVVLAFFILAVQLFITILEFKLTTLAGFVLVPFALWGKTAFLAERVLGNVVSSGIKVMVLAVIVGIGTTFFAQFTSALQGQQPDLSAGHDVGAGLSFAFRTGHFWSRYRHGVGFRSTATWRGRCARHGRCAGRRHGARGAGAMGAGRLAAGAGMGAIRAGSAVSGAASMAYQMGQATSGESGAAGIGAGLAGVATAGAGAVGNAARSAGEKIASTSRRERPGRTWRGISCDRGPRTGKPANENSGASPPVIGRRTELGTSSA